MKNFQSAAKHVLYLALCVVKKWSTHNFCDNCGFTKEKVYMAEQFIESGYVECKRCYNERTKI